MTDRSDARFIPADAGSAGTALSPDRFRALLDVHGAALDTWPPADRAGAARLVATSAEARRCLEEARRLDLALDGLRPPPPSDLLRARLDRLPGAAAESPGRGRLGTRALAASVAAAAVLGMVLGGAGTLMMRPVGSSAGVAATPSEATAGTAVADQPDASLDLAALSLVGSDMPAENPEGDFFAAEILAYDLTLE